MSIATKGGDAGTTGLAGGLRTSKADLRVEALGTVDELNTFLGFARSICSQEDVAGWTETIQRTLFRVGSALATPPEARKTPPIEATDGILSDWSLPGADPQSAAYEMARTVCRRAERLAVRFNETMAEGDPLVIPEVLAYLNRLSDLIWLFGRLIEVRGGKDARLRTDSKAGPNFSRAW
jgi:cob(I)alamin adenosyltransferase